MGNKIFIRKRSGMETTEFGDEILPYINQILETNRRLDHGSKRNACKSMGYPA